MTIQKQYKQNGTVQAVVECTILSSFCHPKKLSRHTLANRIYADVKSFRLSKVMLKGWLAARAIMPQPYNGPLRVLKDF